MNYQDFDKVCAKLAEKSLADNSEPYKRQHFSTIEDQITDALSSLPNKAADEIVSALLQKWEREYAASEGPETVRMLGAAEKVCSTECEHADSDCALYVAREIDPGSISEEKSFIDQADGEMIAELTNEWDDHYY